MQFGVISIFPEMYQALTDFGVTGRAVDKGLVSVDVWNPRDFTIDKYQTVDDRPYGGGPGMLMKVEPLKYAIEAAKAKLGSQSKVVYLSPQGETLTQDKAQQLAQEASLIFLAGRYEGIDERLIETQIDEEISIGDYVLSGGELASMVVMDSVIRLVPEVLGHDMSAVEDSFVDGLLDCPHYTRPEEHEGRKVPDVLLSGNHEKIRQWRLKQALGRTWEKRPDLLAKRDLSKEEDALLQEYKRDVQGRGDA
ncbi:tRNA (guanosine(37)-N1)-methyltransferase TrmD [Bermanella marisrubri]|uniref:tRNA (guanine-N(1)-)-methyltransferase n=1 Tax=Bermanella marisrubri TaxID=207949 RepID=Q1MYQ8_9GAMM|nr:tRNA (guanosine(37)-N1)-methyltransferase TrmD [Bermanella marisrubri]EAT11148.1 tRNA (guanine-N(1)-)-methyltransferase [Oceanobacter sp. RED65] [Bermanella marisrubri]QIZ83468.1 tRNA (guanosine(37)-N1)-methyltransferase TrmD [Bermanella marisrubri]